MFLTHCDDAASRVGRFGRHFGYSSQKELESYLPGTLVADCLQKVVVGLAMFFEEMGQVKKRSSEDSVFDQKEGNQEAPNAAVAVEKRVDRLEVRMRYADLDQHRHRLFIV